MTSCESDDKKLARLEREKLIACLVAERDSTMVHDVGNTVESLQELSNRVNVRTRGDTAEADRLDSAYETKARQAGLDTLTKNWSDESRRCDLAVRAYNRFMR